MNMKYLFASLLSLSLISCGNNKEPEQEPVSAEATEIPDPANEETETITEPEDDTDSLIAEQLPTNTPEPAPFTGGMAVDENAEIEVEEDSDFNIE